jgi:hypothetical protein
MPPLPAGVVARVGNEVVSVRSVQETARTQSVAPREALDRLVVDALMAALARARLRDTGTAKAIRRAVLARALLESIRDQARSRGLPTDAELARVRQRRWWEFDKPPSVRTSHAAALVERPERSRQARAVAERIARAVRGATDPEEFMRRARDVDPGQIEVRVESLPPVSADGRVVKMPQGGAQDTQRFDVRFARAANAIEAVGQQSPVIESNFGWHVILLEERLAGQRVSDSELRSRVLDEVILERANAQADRLLKVLSSRHKIQIERNAAEGMELVAVEP